MVDWKCFKAGGAALYTSGLHPCLGRNLGQRQSPGHRVPVPILLPNYTSFLHRRLTREGDVMGLHHTCLDRDLEVPEAAEAASFP